MRRLAFRVASAVGSAARRRRPSPPPGARAPARLSSSGPALPAGRPPRTTASAQIRAGGSKRSAADLRHRAEAVSQL